MLNKWQSRGDHFAVELWSDRSGDSKARLKRLYALVDSDGLTKMMAYTGTWGARESKRLGTYYVVTSTKGDRSRLNVWLHRIVTNCPDGLEPDHINYDGLDNRLINLKIGTHRDNILTKRPPRKTPCLACGNVPEKISRTKRPRGSPAPNTVCAKCGRALNIPTFVYCRECMIEACFQPVAVEPPLRVGRRLRSKLFVHTEIREPDRQAVSTRSSK